MPSFLFVPSSVRGNGSGHLVRCMTLARELDSLPGCSAGVFLPEDADSASRNAAEIERAFPERIRGLRILKSRGEAEGWDFVVLDRRSASAGEERRWRSPAATIALDEGGPALRSASYLVDILPRPGTRSLSGAPNLESLGFLHLPSLRRPAPPVRFDRVLLAFGGEDPGNLGLGTARALVERGIFAPGQITLLSGALRGRADEVPEGVTVLLPVRDLKEHLAAYDLVITQFGLTAFEAAWARCAVVLVNPGHRHAALSRKAGFSTAGTGRTDTGTLARLVSDPPRLAASSAAVLPDRAESLAERLAALKTGADGLCPVCGLSRRTALARYPRKSYFRCGSCGMIYRELFEGGGNPYDENYFFEEYRRQYGRTYLEDFPALSDFAARRLYILERLLPLRAGGPRPSVLDVGCAYGAFLAEAARRGWDARGLDISEAAASHVRDSLGLPAEAGDFLDPGVQADLAGPVDSLTLWYVIEHFDRLGAALRTAARLVRPGGILAFSTPSAGGVSAVSDPVRFFERSPDDHVTVWEPQRTAGILRRFGFRVERISVTGHHPERFPGALGQPRLARLSGAASRLLGLGDTFECYARRVRYSGEVA